MMASRGDVARQEAIVDGGAAPGTGAEAVTGTAGVTGTGAATASAIIDAAERSGVRVGLVARRLGGAIESHRADEIFLSASTIKIGIIIELFRQVDSGELSLDQAYVLQQTDQAAGSGVLQHLTRGVRLPLRDLCYLMMSISDNLATNILIDQVGQASVNACLRSLGLERSILGRTMQGRLAVEGEQENLTSCGAERRGQ